jgi:hypothetical protein
LKGVAWHYEIKPSHITRVQTTLASLALVGWPLFIGNISSSLGDANHTRPASGWMGERAWTRILAVAGTGRGRSDLCEAPGLKRSPRTWEAPAPGSNPAPWRTCLHQRETERKTERTRERERERERETKREGVCVCVCIATDPWICLSVVFVKPDDAHEGCEIPILVNA